jgi:hypothetical protein
MDGFHFYNGNMKAKWKRITLRAFDEDVIQYVIFDGNEESAKLMGVEYIVSRALFEKRPAEEKHLWHRWLREHDALASRIPGAARITIDAANHLTLLTEPQLSDRILMLVERVRTNH